MNTVNTGDISSNCHTLGWTILRKILGVCTNCILANKIRNVNSQISSTKKDSSTKYKKFKSK